MKLALATLLGVFALLGQVHAAQYSTVNVEEIERLLAGTEQEKAAATFYLGGTLDALELTNAMLTEQGTPMFCPAAEDDLRPSTLVPKLQEHIAELRRKPRAAAALQQLTAGTITMVFLTMNYPCDLEGAVPLPPAP